MMLKDCPCKVVQVKTAKTGKHGHAKCNITGKDVRDGKKKHELQPGHIVMRQFDMKREDIEVTNIHEENGEIYYLDETNEEQVVEVNFTDEKTCLPKFLKEYKANLESGSDDYYTVSVIRVPVGKPTLEEIQVLVVDYKKESD